MSNDEERPTTPSEVISGPATRSDYAVAICETYRQTVKGIFRMGELLIEAKDALSHGAFGPMVKEDLPFGPRTARRLMAVARDDRLNRTRASDLPPSWTILYQLTTLDRWQWAAVEPHLSPDLTRSEVRALVSGEEDDQRSLLPPRRQTARQQMEEALEEVPEGERDRARKLVARPNLPPGERARRVKTLAEASAKQRELWYELSEAEIPELRDKLAVQLGFSGVLSTEAEDLPGVAHRQRNALLKSEEADVEDELIEEARQVLSLQALLRWANVLCDQTEQGDFESGIWAVRNPDKLARDAQRVADQLVRLTSRLRTQVDREF